MQSQDIRNRYWDTQAESSNFSLAFDPELLARHIPKSARILDLGCGYGRTLRTLLDAGFSDVSGVDPASRMVERCRAEVPEASVSGFEALPTLLPDASFDAVLIVAVFTCVPEEDGQQALRDEALRLVRPGGLIYVSDFLLCDDARNHERYRAGLAEYGSYGVFSLPDGAVHRHHDPTWVGSHFGLLNRLHYAEASAKTRNGNLANSFTFLATTRTPGDTNDLPSR
ncbi:MAG: class I SAM-dependent methyltransferase [bacterium]|nr:class I SAM-dependent methyltransferase [bacterium]